MDLIQIGGGTQTLNKTGPTVFEDIKKKANAAINPTSALIYVINKCHLKCDHCYETEDSHPTHHQLSLEEYDRILDELAELGVLWLTFSGGEVFLRRDFLDIVALARQKRFSVAIFSSGTLINEKKADRIAALKVNRVELSLYSPYAHIHDEFTKTPRSHERTLRAARLLIERGVRVTLKTNIMTINKDHLREYKRMAEEIGAKYNFDPSVNSRSNGDMEPIQYSLKPEELRQLMSDPELGMAWSEKQAEQSCNGEGYFDRPDAHVCGAARTSFTVGADGGVYPCASFPIHGGSLKENSLREIWDNSTLLNNVRNVTMKDLKGCQTCEVKSTCTPCQAYAYIENNDHLGCNKSSLNTATAYHLHTQDVLKAN